MAEQDFECFPLAARDGLWEMETRAVNMKTLISNLATTVSLRQVAEILPRPQEVSGSVPTT